MSQSNAIKIANRISARLSLRDPQDESLRILCDVLEQFGLSKDPDLNRWIELLRQQYPTVKGFERAFPSLCFALATGVGKTRLMGAMIAWLYLTGRSRHFFVLAPNLTIYEKLKMDFLPGSPKYVFQGIPELAQTPPVLITGDDYQEGRGVRLDYAIAESKTGDLFGSETAPHINIFNISKINALDNAKGAAKSKVAKIRRIQEYVGESYFSYLANLPDLVVLMDEAHRYYASAGAQALNDLNPVLGIELTATPKTVGANPRDFKNIIYHYPLSRALKDGYVKIPAVATRKDFRAANYSEEQLEKIKLEDGIHHHEYVKTELTSFANNTGNKLVKPFMLVVAQDTDHADRLKARIEHDDFFNGAYKGKAITVHSNQTGEESEETMQRLLAVEHDKDTEIVIHVNKLKEGWDVTNLYTIVPLRASASEILTEQTIGRGLRLPYGKRTGVEAVDRLTIIAHDRFQDIIDRANNDDSIIKKVLYIGLDDDENGIPEVKPQQIVVPSMAEFLLGNQVIDNNGLQACEPQAIYQTNSVSKPVLTTKTERKVAELTFKIVSEEAKRLTSSQQLSTPEVKASVTRRVQQALREWEVTQHQISSSSEQLDLTEIIEDQAEQTSFPSMEDAEVQELVGTITEKLMEYTIDIPRIVVLPEREVNYGFNDFNLSGLDRIAPKPGSKELLLTHLENNEQRTISWREGGEAEERLENYLIRYLLDHDEIDYDEHADMLYKLAGQMVIYLCSYQPQEDAESVLKNAGRQLAEFMAIPDGSLRVSMLYIQRHSILPEMKNQEIFVLRFPAEKKIKSVR
jgi:type III restriction enzyme